MHRMLAGMLLGIVSMLSGCASLVSGTTQAVTFQSVPDDVIVTLITKSPDEQYWKEKSSRRGSSATGNQEVILDPDSMMGLSRILGKTPFTSQLERADRRYVVFSKEGYTSVAKQLTTGTNGAFWGNILSGGLPGSSTDSVSGAIYEYEPSHYLVTLTPLHSSAIESPMLYSQREKIRAFALLRYANILSDLSAGHGEDVSALLTMLGIEANKESEARHRLQAMADAQPGNRALFATQATDRYLK